MGEKAGPGWALGGLGLLCNKINYSAWWLEPVCPPSHSSLKAEYLRPHLHLLGATDILQGLGKRRSLGRGQLAGPGLVQGTSLTHWQPPLLPPRGQSPGQRKEWGWEPGWGCQESVASKKPQSPHQAPGRRQLYCLTTSFWDTGAPRPRPPLEKSQEPRRLPSPAP